MKPMTLFHHRCTHSLSGGPPRVIGVVKLILRRQTCRKKLIWTSVIFLISGKKIWGARRAQTSDPYDTVGKNKAWSTGPIMGKDF